MRSAAPVPFMPGGGSVLAGVVLVGVALVAGAPDGVLDVTQGLCPAPWTS